MRSAKSGKTTITVSDLSTKDDFHLTGPGVNRKTGIAFKGVAKWTVNLQKATYAFRSDAHQSLARHPQGLLAGGVERLVHEPVGELVVLAPDVPCR